VWTTSGHFRVDGLEVDTLAASEATLEWKRKLTGDKATISLKLVASKAHVEGTAKQTDFMFHEGQLVWELSGTTITGFVVDPNAGVGGLPLKVLGHLVIVAGHVKEGDLELQGALPTPTPVVINALGLHIDFGPKVAAKKECIQTIGLVDTTPYDTYKALDYYIPLLRQLATAQPGALRQPVPPDVPALPDGTVMAFKGADAPPHVIIHGPSGQVFDTGSGNAPVQEAGFAALKNDKLDIAEVVIPTPAGGRWTVEAAPDSSRLVEAIQADGTRPVTATAKVTGSGHDRRLDYTVKGLPAGGRVEFAEAGDGGGGLIGTAKADGRGTVKFHPAAGAPGKREIQAVVCAADGYLTARLPLGKYTAPAPERPARATKLTVRRSGKRLVLPWHGDRSAYTQQVDIRSAAGLNLTRTVRRSTTSIALPAAGTKLVVGVTGTTRSGLAGTAARFNTRVPAAKKAKKRHSKR
jgi:hypothetical protein